MMQQRCGYTSHFQRFSSHISSHFRRWTPVYATSLLATMPGPYNDQQVTATDPGRTVLNIETRHLEAGGSMYTVLAEYSKGYRVHMHEAEASKVSLRLRYYQAVVV